MIAETIERQAIRPPIERVLVQGQRDRQNGTGVRVETGVLKLCDLIAKSFHLSLDLTDNQETRPRILGDLWALPLYIVAIKC